jgi:hypothetical protein
MRLGARLIAIAAAAACARSPGSTAGIQPSAPVASAPVIDSGARRPETVAPRIPPVVDSTGNSFFGLVLGEPVPVEQWGSWQCASGRVFATLGGRYRVASDDILFRSPHEHSDSTAVLAALDSVQVCFGQLQQWRATLMAVIVDSALVKLAVTWTDTLAAPGYDSLRAPLLARFGPAPDASTRSDTWEPDSLAIDLSRTSWWLPGAPQLYVTHGRGCDRYEELVHRREPSRNWVDPRTRSCWHHNPRR